MNDVIKNFLCSGQAPKRVDLARAVLTGNDGDAGFVGALLLCIAVCKGGNTVLESVDKSRILQLEIERMIHAHWDSFKRYET